MAVIKHANAAGLTLRFLAVGGGLEVSDNGLFIDTLPCTIDALSHSMCHCQYKSSGASFIPDSLPSVKYAAHSSTCSSNATLESHIGR